MVKDEYSILKGSPTPAFHFLVFENEMEQSSSSVEIYGRLFALRLHCIAADQPQDRNYWILMLTAAFRTVLFV